MPSEPTTTIKVPRALRDQISAEAARAGTTAAGYLRMVIAERARADRFAAVRAAYDVPTDASYRDETEAWDAISSDGLDA